MYVCNHLVKTLMVSLRRYITITDKCHCYNQRQKFTKDIQCWAIQWKCFLKFTFSMLEVEKHKQVLKKLKNYRKCVLYSMFNVLANKKII